LRSPSSSRRKLRVKFCYNNNPIQTYQNQQAILPLKLIEENNLETKLGSFIEGTRKVALKNALVNVNQRLQVGFDTIQELFAAGIEDIIQEVIHLIKGNSHNLTSVEKDLSRSIVKQGQLIVQNSDLSEPSSKVLVRAFEF
jgi:hypothetical protein